MVGNIGPLISVTEAGFIIQLTNNISLICHIRFDDLEMTTELMLGHNLKVQMESLSSADW